MKSVAALTVNLGNPVSNTGEAAGDTYNSIENLRGSGFNDTLIGDSSGNFLRGNVGANILNGGAGFDWADYFEAATGVTVNLGNAQPTPARRLATRSIRSKTCGAVLSATP